MQPASYRLKQEAMELELGKNIGMLIRRVIGQSGGEHSRQERCVHSIFFDAILNTCLPFTLLSEQTTLPSASSSFTATLPLPACSTATVNVPSL